MLCCVEVVEWQRCIKKSLLCSPSLSCLVVVCCVEVCGPLYSTLLTDERQRLLVVVVCSTTPTCLTLYLLSDQWPQHRVTPPLYRHYQLERGEAERLPLVTLFPPHKEVTNRVDAGGPVPYASTYTHTQVPRATERTCPSHLSLSTFRMVVMLSVLNFTLKGSITQNSRVKEI